MDTNRRPTLEDVLMARKRIERHIVRTPLHRHISLDDFVGAKIFVKHENHQKLGAFKVRGGLNLLSQMSQEELKNGVSTASSGNHGQSIAYAASLYGTKAHIAVPDISNPGKVQSMKNLGAEVIHHGDHFGAANEFMEHHSKEKGYFYIHPVKNMTLYAGVGTYTLEILEDLPDVDTIIVPVGGGSGAASSAIVAKSIKPNVSVIGVQSISAPAVFQSWKSGDTLVYPMESIAEGLATNTAYEPALSILKDLLDDFILVSDEEMEDAILLHLEHSRNLIEHAGAASLAAAIKIKEQLAGQNVVLIASGGNLSMEHLYRAMERYRD
jgi:threonine dehydratase